MPRLRFYITIAVAAGLAGTASVIGFSTFPASAETITVPLRTAVSDLPVADEQRDGYDRDLFPHWIDEDGDGCNTRYEVLIDEATEPPRVDDDCSLTGGQWYSYFDDATVDSASGIGIDHFVPLAEAWDSGAHAWTTDQRRAFANDLGDERSLVGVSTSSNSSKGDRDPAEWLPPNTSQTCRYISEWTVVKVRWGLTVDGAEKTALTDLAADCPNEDLTIEIVGDAPPSDGACDHFENSTAVDIPDTQIATSDITVSGCSGNAAAASTVNVDITHPDRSDVSIWLYAPDGTHYVLKSSGDALRTEYEVDLSAEPKNGDWTLSVKDYGYGDVGTLNSWSIRP